MLSAGVLAGVVIGVVLSLGWLVYVATRPAMPLLGREPGTQVFRDLDENPEDETSGRRRPAARRRACSSPPRRRSRTASASLVDGDGASRALVLDLEGVNFVDSQGAAKLAEIHELRGPAASRCGLRASSRRCSRCSSADGVVDLIGADHIHGNVHRAVEAEIA